MRGIGVVASREKFSYKRLFNLILGTIDRRSYRARIQLSDLIIEVGGLEELGAGGACGGLGPPYGTSLQTRLQVSFINA